MTPTGTNGCIATVGPENMGAGVAGMDWKGVAADHGVNVDACESDGVDQGYPEDPLLVLYECECCM